MIKNLSVQHFRSLSNVSIALGNVTVLVGPNGSGKSNVVDAFRFLRDSVVDGLEHAIDQRGGLSIIRQYSPTKPYTVTFAYSLSLRDDDAAQDLPAHHVFKIGGSKDEPVVVNETADWYGQEFYVVNEGDGPGEFRRRWQFGRLVRSEDGSVEVTPDDGHKVVVRPESLAVGTAMRRGILGAESPIAPFLSRMRFASVYPNIMREPRRLETERTLREDCSNWGSIVKRLRDTRPGERALDRMIDLMKIVLPGLRGISVRNVGGYAVPQFLVSDRPGEKGHFLDPIQLSDGTLRLFGLLLHLYQSPPPSLLAIEEPEQTIHPGLIGVLVDAIREAAQLTQVLVTTHSPYVLDHFSTDDILVTSVRDTGTHVSPIRSTQIAAVKRGLMSLSEVMALDGLLPEDEGEG